MLTEMFSQENFAHYTSQNIRGYLGPGQPLKCILGLGILSFDTQIFDVGEELLRDVRIVQAHQGGSSVPVLNQCTPIGINPQQLSQARLQSHLDDNVRHYLNDYPDTYCEHHLKPFQQLVLRQICRYYKESGSQEVSQSFQTSCQPDAGQSSLLGKTLKLHLLSHMMSTTILIWEGPFSGQPASRLVKKQVKGKLCPMHVEAFQDVFENLDRILRAHDRSTWASSFCVVALLMMVFERMQITIMEFISTGQALWDFSHSYREAWDLCRLMEKVFIDHLVVRFHMCYRTNKRFNPFLPRENYDVVDRRDEAGRTLIYGMRMLFATDGKCPKQQALGVKPTDVDPVSFEQARRLGIPTLQELFQNSEDDANAPERFAVENHSRHLLRFLVSFLSLSSEHREG